MRVTRVVWVQQSGSRQERVSTGSETGSAAQSQTTPSHSHTCTFYHNSIQTHSKHHSLPPHAVNLALQPRARRWWRTPYDRTRQLLEQQQQRAGGGRAFQREASASCFPTHPIAAVSHYVQLARRCSNAVLAASDARHVRKVRLVRRQR